MRKYKEFEIVESSTPIDTSALGRAIINKLRSLVKSWGDGEYAYFSYEFLTNPWKDSQGNPLNTSIQFSDVPLYVGFPNTSGVSVGLHIKVDDTYLPANAQHVEEFNMNIKTLTMDFFKDMYDKGYTLDQGYYVKYKGAYDIPLAINQDGLHTIVLTYNELPGIVGIPDNLDILISGLDLYLVKLVDLRTDEIDFKYTYRTDRKELIANTPIASSIEALIFAPDVREDGWARLRYLIPVNNGTSAYQHAIRADLDRVYAMEINGAVYPDALLSYAKEFISGESINRYLGIIALPVSFLKKATIISNEFLEAPMPYFTDWNDLCRTKYRLVSYKGALVPESRVADLRLQEVLGGNPIAEHKGIKFIRTSDDIINNLDALPSMVRERQFKVNSHNYSPEGGPVFYKSSDNVEPNPLYLGCEIELNRGGETNDNAAMLLVALGNGKNVAYAMHDGSLNNGIEIATHPATLEEHKNTSLFNYEHFFNLARAIGFRGYDEGSGRAGLHIHVSKKYFVNYKLALHFMSMFVHSNWNELLTFTRRGTSNSFAAPVGSVNTRPNKLSDIISLAQFINPDGTWNAHKASGKYTAINVEKEHTLEFRIFRGTLNETTYLATLEFVDALCRWANEMCIEVMSTSNLEECDFKGVLSKLTEFKDATIKTLAEKSGKDTLKRYISDYSKYKTDKSDKELQ